MALALRDVSVARGGIPVLEGVSFSVAKGEALTLRGPNGIGKTTLLRAIAGLQPVLSGEIDADPEAIAYAAHSDGLKPTLTVAENLSFWAQVFGTSSAEPALDAFELRELADRPAQNLSAGQKRRLGLARMLVTGRPVWVFDEPTVSLDKDHVALFARILERHLAGGGSALLATHIELGIGGRSLDLGSYRAKPSMEADFDEAFL